MKKIEDFILSNTSLRPLTLLPEISLRVTDKFEDLWKIMEKETGDADIEPPYWSVAWPGGQGLARFILDNPDSVKGKRILDFASGSGIVGIAAAKTGAKEVCLSDIDPYAKVSALMNAKDNDVFFRDFGTVDFARLTKGIDLILAGDIFYEHLLANRALAWLRRCVAAGVEVIVGDPGRGYVPKENVEVLATYIVPTSLELEDKDERQVSILRLVPYDN